MTGSTVSWKRPAPTLSAAAKSSTGTLTRYRLTPAAFSASSSWARVSERKRNTVAISTTMGSPS